MLKPAQYKKIRLKLKLTQKQLAKKLGVDWITIWRRETGRVPITKESELAIIKITEQSKSKKK